MSMSYEEPFSQQTTINPTPPTNTTVEESSSSSSSFDSSDTKSYIEIATTFLSDQIDGIRESISELPSIVTPVRESLPSLPAFPTLPFFSNTSSVEESSSSTIPQPPHGDPPTDSNHQGSVAFEDKTLTAKVTENLENLKEGIQSIANKATESIHSQVEVISQTITNVISPSSSIENNSTMIPEGPHGQPPSDSGRGYVANEDKSLTVKVVENWETLKESIGGLLGSNNNNNQGCPDPPHGMPPGDGEKGFVAYEDKSLTMKVEDNWEILKEVTQQKIEEWRGGGVREKVGEDLGSLKENLIGFEEESTKNNMTVKLGENWETLKDVTQQKWNELKEVIGQRTEGSLKKKKKK